MKTIWLRRLAVIVIALILGYLVTYFEVHSSWRTPAFLNSIPVMGDIISVGDRQFGLGTTFEDYGPTYTILTVLAFATGFGLYLDKFLKSDMLPH